MFDEVIYTVDKISGDYAFLISEDGNENQVALALLPSGTDEGTRLKCTLFEYEIIE